MSIDVAVSAGMFRLLGDPTRLRILLACLDRPRPVGEIAEEVGVSPSLVSHHLRLLKGARLVRATREARHVFYVAADEHVRHMLHDVIEHAAEDDLPNTPDA
ncbi:ArsR/SmtB family transcription factor [Falsirhodobacter deserti]|uniref:ArsR/SmtB family transcription factor n=1 Tax=Falsirhodobacter deserti TaxID=1365611 RepID=UPI001F4EC7D3|nr:metalloregulator ArsR/SmtB family transcription factor [Falsirhodobacter deserti]